MGTGFLDILCTEGDLESEGWLETVSIDEIGEVFGIDPGDSSS